MLGDGGLATSALLSSPGGIAFDPAGNLFIADQLHHRIRKVDPNGVISTIAGTGSPGYAGDDGPATDALLNGPTDVVLDLEGNLYIADQGNQCVRRIANGIITTMAGNGLAGYSGDGGPAVAATLNNPTTVTVDSNQNLYVADTSNQVIRRVTRGGMISTIAGNGSAGFSGDGAPAGSATLNSPMGVRVSSGTGTSLYIADFNNNRVRLVSLSPFLPTPQISTAAGNGASSFAGDYGVAVNASLQGPLGVAFDTDGSSYYFVDSRSHRVRKIVGGVIFTVAGNGFAGSFGDGQLATSASLNSPTAVTVGPDGSLYISEGRGNRIRKVKCTTTSLIAIAPTLKTGFTVSSGFPISIDVVLVDNCFDAISNATVIAAFSNGDPPVPLKYIGDGHWSATWAPGNTQSASITVSVTAKTSSLQTLLQVAAATSVNATVPRLADGGVANVAAYMPHSTVSPGELVSIYGTNLADGVVTVGSLPLPTSVAGTSVSIGGKFAPLLYVSPSQINAFVPFDVSASLSAPIIVYRGTLFSVPSFFTVGGAQPAIFTMSQTGSGQGAITNAVGTAVVDQSAPARPGDAIVIYATGLGTVDPPANPGTISQITNSISVLIGGTNVTILFAGLTPGYNGLYQVNAVVPSGIATGNQVPVIMTVAGQPSNVVTIAVQ